MPQYLSAMATPRPIYVAARGHHADVGGITPGSMPPGSVSVEEEGVILDNVLLVDRRHGSAKQICARCWRPGAWPARNIDQNIGDLARPRSLPARAAPSRMVTDK
jgi:5-oxoprolinase (ATP-hydrolysing)